MGKHEEKTMKCPSCGKEQSVTVWESINTQADEGAKQKILDRTINTFTCGACGKSFQIKAPLLFNDMRSSYMIYYMPDLEGEEVQKRIGELRARSKEAFDLFQYKELRLVTSYQELVEKIFLFDDGLNDKIVEFLKLFLYTKLEKEPVDCILFERLDDKGNLEFFVEKAGESTALLVPMSSYEAIEEMLRQKKIDIVSNQWERVDLSYAISLSQDEPFGN